MRSPLELQVLLVCGIAFAAVFVLLSILSVTMSVITSAFRASEVPALPAPAAMSPPVAPAPAAASVDEAVVAAITSTVMNLYPNVRVSKIEELK